MILINLMPHREWARQRRLQRGLMILALTALMGLALSWMAAEALEHLTHARSLEHESLIEQVDLHARRAREVVTLKAKTHELREQEQALQGLVNRSAWRARLAADVAAHLPPSVRLSALRLDDTALHLAGLADDLPALNDWLNQDLGLQEAPPSGHHAWRLGPAQWLELRSQREGLVADSPAAQALFFSLKLPLVPQP